MDQHETYSRLVNQHMIPKTSIMNMLQVSIFTTNKGIFLSFYLCLSTIIKTEVRRLQKTMQCAYFCVQLSEAIIGRSSIIENQTIHTKYSVTTRCVMKHIYNNIYGLINETGLCNRNKVLRARPLFAGNL